MRVSPSRSAALSCARLLAKAQLEQRALLGAERLLEALEQRRPPPDPPSPGPSLPPPRAPPPPPRRAPAPRPPRAGASAPGARCARSPPGSARRGAPRRTPSASWARRPGRTSRAPCSPPPACPAVAPLPRHAMARSMRANASAWARYTRPSVSGSPSRKFCNVRASHSIPSATYRALPPTSLTPLAHSCRQGAGLDPHVVKNPHLACLDASRRNQEGRGWGGSPPLGAPGETPPSMRPLRWTGWALWVTFLAALPAVAAPERAAYVLIIANNTGLDDTQAPLRFADDDGARYYELLSPGARETVLLSVLDADTQTLHPGLAARTRPPTRAALQEALGRFNAAHERGPCPGRPDGALFHLHRPRQARARGRGRGEPPGRGLHPARTSTPRCSPPPRRAHPPDRGRV